MVTTKEKIIAALKNREPSDQPESLADASEKGGVGKTSVTSGLIAVAAEMGLEVVGGDLDPRATLTKELGVTDPEFSINDVMYVDPEEPPTDPAELVHDALVPAGPGWPSNVRVLASERALGRRELDPTPGMELRLRRALQGLKGDVDLVILDAPPRPGGKLMGAILIAANRVLIPATLTEDGYDGAVELMRSISHIAAPGGLNPNLVVAGVVFSIVPKRGEMRDVHFHHEKAIREEFGDLVMGDPEDVYWSGEGGVLRPDGPVIRNYAIREECRTACIPITAAPGREAKRLVSSYEQVLLRSLAAKGGVA
ncbi:ParA family protein [Streptomyces sp. 5-10]|uniref:ParA family protein n=1 Tax=Streptomyces sp. 5-10 TaxID=878925 RepID=UPI00168AEB19|nr:ParA family protein [Streptomyces sp. 5-10]MBD3004841.1 ParA family protein [Streptomyces sp. 5-10]